MHIARGHRQLVCLCSGPRRPVLCLQQLLLSLAPPRLLSHAAARRSGRTLREVHDALFGSSRGMPVSDARVHAALRAYYAADACFMALVGRWRRPPPFAAPGAAAVAVGTAARLRFAVALSGLSRNTVVSIIRHFEATGELRLESRGTRSAAAPAYARWPSLPGESSRRAFAAVIDAEVVDAEAPFWFCAARHVAVRGTSRSQALMREYGRRLSMPIVGAILKRWSWQCAYAELARRRLRVGRGASALRGASLYILHRRVYHSGYCARLFRDEV